MMQPRLAVLLALSTLAAACDSASTAGADASATDAPSADVTDATTRDATTTDAASDTPSTDTDNDATNDTTAADVAADVTADVTTDVAADVADVAADVAADVTVLDASAPDASLDAVADAPASDVAADLPDAAGLCAMLPANTAPVIMDTFDTAPMPPLSSLTGGVVPPGTYHETRHTYRGVATGTVHTWQATTLFYPGATVAAVNINRDGVPFQQLAERIVYTGGAMSVTIVCPSTLAGAMVAFGYTYAAGELHIYTYFDNTETVFTRQ
jgi:hypothetical protein